MSNEVVQMKPGSGVDVEALQRVILGGDLALLKPEQKIQYYNRVCELVGLNPLTKPFDYIKLNGKEVLYANKGCGEQLRMVHKISIKIAAREKIDDVYVVTAEAAGADGRVDSSTGAVPVAGLKGETLANAMMKAETKAKRRVTLSICGLNMLDDTEVETIPGVREPGRIVAEQPPEDGGDGIIGDESYRIDFGKYARRSLEEVGVENLRNYVDYLERTSTKENKPIDPNGKVGIFIRYATNYIIAWENSEIES